MVLAKLGTNIG